MLMVLSPAKTLDLNPYDTSLPCTVPQLLSESEKLARGMSRLSARELGSLMDISPKLAALNAERFRDFKTPFTTANAKPAALMFKGDVYAGLRAERYDAEDFTFATHHLRILSGLYGLLRPLDLIQPYRLEMGTDVRNPRGENLYDFWGERISNSLNEALTQSGSKLLINLASQEYFKAVRLKPLKADLLTVTFKDGPKHHEKIISFFAKRARGLMADYVICNRLQSPDKIKDFNEEGYRFREDLSDNAEWVFTRAAKSA